jgi:hypothetical protein
VSVARRIFLEQWDGDAWVAMVLPGATGVDNSDCTVLAIAIGNNFVKLCRCPASELLQAQSVSFPG